MVCDSLDITVNANFEIPQETVERCLKIIEWWLNDNPNKRISGGYRENGENVIPFTIEERKV